MREGVESGSPGMTRGLAWARVAGLVVAVGGVFALIAATGSISEDRVHDAVDPLGAIAPFAFIVVAALLVCALFPVPLLAAASGLLFATAVGTAVTILASTIGAVLAFVIARRAAGDAADVLAGRRVTHVRAWIEERGFVAVLYARIAPLPYSVVSYVGGLTHIRLPVFAAASALGVAPRAYVYTALSGNLDDLTSPEALVAGVLMLGMFALGLVLLRRERAQRRAPRPPTLLDPRPEA